MAGGNIISINRPKIIDVNRQNMSNNGLPIRPEPKKLFAARKCLFGKSDPEETRRLVEEIDTRNRQEWLQKYGFDILRARFVNVDDNIINNIDVTDTGDSNVQEKHQRNVDYKCSSSDVDDNKNDDRNSSILECNDDDVIDKELVKDNENNCNVGGSIRLIHKQLSGKSHTSIQKKLHDLTPYDRLPQQHKTGKITDFFKKTK